MPTVKGVEFVSCELRWMPLLQTCSASTSELGEQQA